MKHVTIRFANKEDFGQLYALGIRYYNESIFAKKGMKLSTDAMTKLIIQCIEGGTSLVADAEGEIVGMCLMSVSFSLFDSGDLGVDVFYVTPEWRGTACGNSLQDAVMEIVRKGGFACVYEASTSGFGQKTERQFSNMLVKRGFMTTGPVCIFLNPDCAEMKHEPR